MLCMNCGQELPKDGAVCPHCGFTHAEEEIQTLGMQALQIDRFDGQEAQDQDALIEAILQTQPEGIEITPEELDLESILAENFDTQEGPEDLLEEELYPVQKAPEKADDEEQDDDPIIAPTLPKKAPGKKLWILAGAAALTVLLAVGAFLGFCYYQNLQSYDRAAALLNEEEYDQALEIFAQLGNFRDSAQKTEMLQQMKLEYEAAVADMLAGNFDGAEEVFSKLGNYRDSAQMLQQGIYWYKGEYLRTCAENRDMSGAALLSGVTEQTDQYLIWVLMFMTAKEQYSQIPEYQDAQQKIQLCYLGAATVLAQEGQMDTAMIYKDRMDEDTQKLFMEQVSRLSADQNFLESLVTSLQARMDTELAGHGDLRPGIRIEQAYLGGYQNAYFLDKNLDRIAHDYLEGVYLQWMALDSRGRCTDPAGWARGEYLRTRAVDELYTQYGLLADREALRQYYVGRSDQEYMFYRIHSSLKTQLSGVMAGGAQAPGGGKYTNDSGFSFNIRFTYTFYLENEPVDTKTLTMAILSEQTKTVQGRTTDMAYDRWSMTWEVFDITGGGHEELAGKYTIYSMNLLQYGSLFTLEDLVAAGRGEDAVELFEDGTGIYTAEGSSKDIAHDGESFWFTDTPEEKISFTVEGNELKFTLEETEYTFTK